MFLCGSDGFFFAVKEVSLLDQGEEGRQSIYQLEQVCQASSLMHVMVICFDPIAY